MSTQVPGSHPPSLCIRCGRSVENDDAAMLPDARAVCTRCVTELLTHEAAAHARDHENQRHAAAGPYRMQWWSAGDDPQRIADVSGLIYDAAVHFARKGAEQHGHTARLMCEHCDYTEVFTPSGEHRSGPFAVTTRVRVPREGSQP